MFDIENIENEVYISYSLSTGTFKIISLHYDLREKNLLRYILSMFDSFKHNYIYMYLRGAVSGLRIKEYCARIIHHSCARVHKIILFGTSHNFFKMCFTVRYSFLLFFSYYLVFIIKSIDRIKSCMNRLIYFRLLMEISIAEFAIVQCVFKLN